MPPTPSPAALVADRALARISGGHDVLLEVTPVNGAEAWSRWQRHRATPSFEYRPVQVAPADLRRQLDAVPVDEVEEDALRTLLTRQCRYLRLQADLVEARLTSRFLPVSLELHGGCDDALLDLATSLLRRLEPADPDVERASPEEFARRATAEIERYRATGPFQGTVQLRDDISSLMVVGRELFVGTDSWLPAHRVEGLVHHEVGTHLLTAETGGRQPLRVLEHGTAGYEETQEALGVLSEHLSDGLDAERLRILAGRAVAVRSLTDGADFVEVMDMLQRHDFSEHAAWLITARVFRGGGYTKDVVYLRGLVGLVDHLASHPIDPLLVGKFHLDDLPVVQRLLDDGVLHPAGVRPRWLAGPDAMRRLASLGDHPVADWLRDPRGQPAPLTT